MNDEKLCPSCGTAVDVRGATATAVDCPVCQTTLDLGRPPGPPSDPVDIEDVVNDFRALGYATPMTVLGPADVACGACGATIAMASVQADDVRRARDRSTGDLTVAAAAFTCPNCQQRGYVVMDYGPDGIGEESALVELLEWGHEPH